MYTSQKVLFNLLRAGLWEREVDLISFPLTDQEWYDVYMLSIQQTIDGIVYDGLTRLPNEYLPPKSLLLKWAVRIEGIERRNRNVNKCIAETVSLFGRHGVFPILLKGSGLASCYERPLHRTSGDVDYYFSSVEEFKKVNKIVMNYGVNVNRGSLYSSYYLWRGIEIEHHTKLLDIMKPFKKAFVDDLKIKEDEQSVHFQLYNTEIKTLSPLLTHIQVNAHILKHFLGFGIGLRQFCDMARLCKTYYTSIDGEALKNANKKLGIFRWTELMHVCLVDYLGLEEKYLPYPLEVRSKSDWLIEEVLNVGNFGFHDKRYMNETDSLKGNRSRNNAVYRVVPHLFKACHYAFGEAIWFPLRKFQTSFDKRSIV